MGTCFVVQQDIWRSHTDNCLALPFSMYWRIWTLYSCQYIIAGNFPPKINSGFKRTSYVLKWVGFIMEVGFGMFISSVWTLKLTPFPHTMPVRCWPTQPFNYISHHCHHKLTSDCCLSNCTVHFCCHGEGTKSIRKALFQQNATDTSLLSWFVWLLFMFPVSCAGSQPKLFTWCVSHCHNTQ